MDQEKSSDHLMNEKSDGVITVKPCNESVQPKRGKKFNGFVRKYFLEGQKLEQTHLHVSLLSGSSNTAANSFYERYRKYIGFLIPFLFMHLCWWSLAFRYNLFRLYPTRYELPVTMILGATVAGMTSEGGGAIAFPVMTLLLHIDSTVARDFSLMIQSCGMTSAAFTIIWMRIQLEWYSIVFCTLGSTTGIIFGFHFVDNLLTNSEKKMLFVSIWFAFGLSLWILNLQKHRSTHEKIQDIKAWKITILILTGFIGGLCSAFAGSGVDICSFSMLTLLFRVSEKTATPTSVVLMAANTCVGFFWRHLIMNEVSNLAWEYFSVSVPVVTICAPMGSLLASHFHRLVLATFVYILEIAALLGFLATGPSIELILVGCVIIGLSFGFFLAISRIGKYIDDRLPRITSPNYINAESMSTPLM
uniref:Uncharacterized protein n=1 Tax=Panagrolaimus sp. PS1159 TaxID=55785 RepID=A0AC35GNP7_9BILA